MCESHLFSRGRALCCLGAPAPQRGDQEQNSDFRRHKPGAILSPTNGRQARPICAICEKIELFDVFTEDNDPHGERDFGAVEREDPRIFRKTRAICMIQQRGSLLQPLISSLMRHKASIGKANMFP
jgi:hypothetical protein